MKKISEIYDIIKETRELIIKTMVERGITEVTILPDKKEWLAEDEERDEVEYDELRSEVCPAVTYFDKYGYGYQCDIFKVILTKNKSDEYIFKMEGDGDEVGYSWFYDYEISYLDMALVCNAVGEILELD